MESITIRLQGADVEVDYIIPADIDEYREKYQRAGNVGRIMTLKDIGERAFLDSCDYHIEFEYTGNDADVDAFRQNHADFAKANPLVMMALGKSILE